ncbi:MAG TPA: hypothetical protein VMW19_11975 [Myxococcota bacterium]|nr:hypothetical protein [Myxococcota bacterium]
MILGGIRFLYGVLTQPPGPAAAQTPVAMVLALAFIWIGFGLFAWFLIQRAIARSANTITQAIRKELSEPAT